MGLVLCRRGLAAAVTAALLVQLLPPGRDAAAGAPCTPVVRVTGEPALVGPVVGLLRERHLAVAGPSRCGTVAATLAAADRGERVRVTITDPDGRTVERIADDPDGAATAIESWARRDVSDPLLQARGVTPGPAPAAAGGPAIEEEAAGPGNARRIEAAIAADGGVSSDGAVWAGVRARGCVQVGALCVGGLARYARDTEKRGDSDALDTARYGLDLLLTADLPLRYGRLSWSPGAGIGQTSVHARRTTGMSDKEDTVAFRMRGHMAGGLRVAGAWSLRLDVAAEYSPFANTLLGDERDDAAGDRPLAGAPRFLGWLGLGISYGGL